MAREMTWEKTFDERVGWRGLTAGAKWDATGAGDATRGTRSAINHSRALTVLQAEKCQNYGQLMKHVSYYKNVFKKEKFVKFHSTKYGVHDSQAADYTKEKSASYFSNYF